MRMRVVVLTAIVIVLVAFGAYCLFQLQVGVNSLIGFYCVTYRSFRLYRFNVEYSPNTTMDYAWIQCAVQDPSNWLLAILISEVIAVACAYLLGRCRKAEKRVWTKLWRKPAGVDLT